MGAWNDTIEQVLEKSSKKKGYYDVIPITDWHLATGLPLGGSGDVQATVRTSSAHKAAKWIAAADASDFLCASVPLGPVLKTYDQAAHGYPEIALYIVAAQAGSGTTSTTLRLQADAKIYVAPAVTDVSVDNIDDTASTNVGGADDTPVPLVFDLTAEMSTAEKASLTSHSMLTLRLHPNEAIATNQLMYVFNAFLVIRRHASTETLLTS